MIVKDPLLDAIFDDKKPEPKHKNIGSKFDDFLEEENIKKEIDEKFGVVIKMFDNKIFKAKESIIFEQGEIKCDGVMMEKAPVCPTKIELIKGIQKNKNFFKE